MSNAQSKRRLKIACKTSISRCNGRWSVLIERKRVIMGRETELTFIIAITYFCFLRFFCSVLLVRNLFSIKEKEIIRTNGYSGTHLSTLSDSKALAASSPAVVSSASPPASYTLLFFLASSCASLNF
ncbi:unnamed protein product [Albugo candida]|uniref:Uncharacterized protein n=1 Tax=Albugo candida TaxID=65357 RepID=A0A024G0S7_9STRA|nr:unnamed protein product [Albugo candida]|eukprot:CCI39890.1 unnamed protein product [Albugo candida]